MIARLKPGAPEVASYTVENPRRGVYSGGEVEVETGAPFGLFYRRRRMRAASDVVVYPRTFDVAGLPPSASLDAERADRSEAQRMHRGHGGEFWGIREYRPGDPARLVAWKRSARTLAAGKLAVLELAQETHPPLKVVMNLDARAPREAREMVVSAGASLLLFGLKEGREVRVDAGSQKYPFPEQTTPDAVLAWCAHLQPGRPPDPAGASVEIRPSIKRVYANRARPRTDTRPGASEAQVVVLVSCREFAGPGIWMSPEEESEFMQSTAAGGRRVLRLGAEVEEPWRI